MIVLPKIHLPLPKLTAVLADYAAKNFTPKARRAGTTGEVLIFKDGRATFFNEPLKLSALPFGILKSFAKRPDKQMDSVKMMARLRRIEVGDTANIFQQYLGKIRGQFNSLAAKLPQPIQRHAKTIAKQIILSEGHGKYRLNLKSCDIQWH